VNATMNYGDNVQHRCSQALMLTNVSNGQISAG
jgi:hypothetical protein